MASAAAGALKQELVAAVGLLDPQILGLSNLQKVVVSGETLAAVQVELEDHLRRWRLCTAVLEAINALEADGFPTTPVEEVSEIVFEELRAQFDAIAAAMAEFTKRPTATSISVALGEPADKSQPSP